MIFPNWKNRRKMVNLGVKKSSFFRRRLRVELRCPVTNESVLRVVVLVQGKSHSPSSHPNYNQTKRAITLKWPHITTLQPVFSGHDTASSHGGSEQIKFLIDLGINYFGPNAVFLSVVPSFSIRVERTGCLLNLLTLQRCSEPPYVIVHTWLGLIWLPPGFLH